jgi:glutamate decarboxylase
LTTLYSAHSDDQSRHSGDFVPLDARLTIPKYNIPQDEHDPAKVYRFVADELMLDGRARQNLATFCTTFEDTKIRSLMDLSISKNMIDKDEYPHTAEIELRCVRMLAELWHAPQWQGAIGTSTTGSSEAAMLAGLAFKWNWRKQRIARGQRADKPNLVTGPVQVCWHKFARYFDVELRELPMEDGSYTLPPLQLAHYCDENTIGVVATLGLTFTGHYDPVEAISSALDDLQSKTGWDIPIHVDAASGGFVAPFLNPEVKWDFLLSRVKSINASGHKYGLAPIGVGWAVWRESSQLPEELIFNVNYLGGNMPTFALNFSRPGGQVIAQYYNLLRFGREGYTTIMSDLQDIAVFIAHKLAQLGIFRLIHRGDEGIPVVTWTLSDAVVLPFSLYDLTHELQTHGWQVPAYSLPRNLENIVVARVVVRYGFTIDMAEAFIADVKGALEYFGKHAPNHPLDAEECHSFNHL